MYSHPVSNVHQMDMRTYSSSLSHSRPMPHPLRAPKRYMCGWAQVKRGGAIRSARRWVVLRSCSVYVLEAPDARSNLLVMPLLGASVTTNMSKLEAVVKNPDGHKLSFIWQTQADFQSFKAAFDFANRNLDDRFKTVSHRLFARRNDSEIGAFSLVCVLLSSKVPLV